MIRTTVKPAFPMDRRKAAIIAGTAARFDCTVTLEGSGLILNLKSIIGLLSQTAVPQFPMDLICDGMDEEAASLAVTDAFQEIAG